MSSCRACGLPPNITLVPNGTSLTNSTLGKALEEEKDDDSHHGGEAEANTVRSFENTTLFYISCFQYIAVALAFAKGRPFRQPTQTNGEDLAFGPEGTARRPQPRCQAPSVPRCVFCAVWGGG